MTALQGSRTNVSENVSDLRSPKSAMLFQKNVLIKFLEGFSVTGNWCDPDIFHLC